MSNKIGFAILGAGIFAREDYLPALAALSLTTPVLKAVYSRSEKSAHALATAAAASLELNAVPDVYHDGQESTNLDALLAKSDINAVIVILPITLQPGIILKALAAGKHVLSEKPVAPDVASGTQLVATYLSDYKPKGLIWRVAENFEAEPGHRAAAKAIREGKIGRVMFFNSRVLNYIDKESKWYKTEWRTIPDYQGGFLLDGGVHNVATLRTILPTRLTHISSFASLNKDYLAPHDTINAIAKSSSHFQGLIQLTFAQPTKSSPASESIIVTGTDGWLSLSDITLPGSGKKGIRVKIKSVVKEDGKPNEEMETTIDEPMWGVETELQSFFVALEGRDDGLGLGDPKGALEDVAFIQAALNSEGELVDLEKLIGRV